MWRSSISTTSVSLLSVYVLPFCSTSTTDLFPTIIISVLIFCLFGVPLLPLIPGNKHLVKTLIYIFSHLFIPSVLPPSKVQKVCFYWNYLNQIQKLSIFKLGTGTSGRRGWGEGGSTRITKNAGMHKLLVLIYMYRCNIRNIFILETKLPLSAQVDTSMAMMTCMLVEAAGNLLTMDG